MTTFDDREKAFEAKFAHDAEMRFRAETRSVKLAGLWAAAQMGKTGDEAEAYARELVKHDLKEAGFEDVVRRLVSDLGNRSDEQTIRMKLVDCAAAAREQLIAEI